MRVGESAAGPAEVATSLWGGDVDGLDVMTAAV